MRTQVKWAGIYGAVLLLAGCGGGKDSQSANGYSDYEKPDTESSVQEMRAYHYSAEVKTDNGTYTYDITREAGDSLPVVYSDEGESFADNYIRLCIQKNGAELFNKTFTKQDFKSFVDKDFLSHSILEGLAFDRIDGQNLVFATSVSYPTTDMYFPLSIIITPGGKYTVTKDMVLDTTGGADSTEVADGQQ